MQNRDLVRGIEDLDGLAYWKTALSFSDKQKDIVKVCVIDNGIHPNVSANQVDEINLTWGSEAPYLGSHGSTIATIYLSGQDNDIDRERMKFYSIRISFEGEEESTYNTDLGMYQVAAALDSAIGAGCHVVNTSFVYHKKDVPADVARVEQAVLQEMERRGMVLVTAAGNYGKSLSGTDFLPAKENYANIVTVGSHNYAGEISCYSNHGQEVDITASGDLLWGSGTSFSTAVVGSATAKAFLLDSEVSWEKVIQSLYTSANKFYYAEEHSCHKGSEKASRHGRLYAKKMFQLVLE